MISVNKNLPPMDIEVDGGINDETARLCVQAGANVLVAGSYLFHLDRMSDGIKKLHESGD